MSAQPLGGPYYLTAGFKMITRPGLRMYVLLPLSINIAVFFGLIYFAVQGFRGWVEQLMPNLPSWLSFLDYLLWPLFVVLVLLIIFFTFTTIANLIASPFNSFLAEKVEVIARGNDHFPPFSWKALLAMVPRTLAREMRKLGYFLPRALGLLILSLIPGINIIAAPLWVVFNIWMMAVQYIDYPADNNNISWPSMMEWIRSRRILSLGFGGITYLALMVPVFNLIAMPAAIAGATLLWVDHHKPPASTY